MKGQKDVNDGKNVHLEVLAPGEEKARSYHVMHDPKIKGGDRKILAEVRMAKAGDRVEIEWVATGHGPAIKAFKILKQVPKK